MMHRSSLGFAMVVVALAGIGVGVAQLGLREDGVQFPDGTVQTTAAEGAGTFVQAQATVQIPDSFETAVGNVYTVPANKMLRIEWISVETAEFGDSTYDPVDIEIGTWLDGVQVFHTLARLDGAMALGTSFFARTRYSSPVTLYSEGNSTVQVLVIRNNSSDETDFIVSFTGRLFDE